MEIHSFITQKHSERHSDKSWCIYCIVCVCVCVCIFFRGVCIHIHVRQRWTRLAQRGRTCWNTPIPRGRSQKMFRHLIGTITLTDSFCSEWATHLGTEPIIATLFASQALRALHLKARVSDIWTHRKNSCSWLAAVQKVPFNNQFSKYLNQKVYGHL